VTQYDSIYAINGTPPSSGSQCNILLGGKVSLLNSQHPIDCNYVGTGMCTTIKPYVGILSTPVIQTYFFTPTTTGTIYVVTETQDVPIGQQPSNYYHWLHALDITTLQEESGSPVRVYPSAYANNPTLFSKRHLQRPGLLLTNGYLYLGFSMMDGIASPLPEGWILGYNTANLNATPLSFSVTPGTPNAAGGGVWQGGAGLAYGLDENQKNYIYFNTGNGNWDGSASFGDSFVKLDPTSLAGPAAYFTPNDQYYRNCLPPPKDNYTDADFGSGGVLLIPDGQLTSWPYLAVSGDKEGGLWFMDRGTPGGYKTSNTCSTTCPTACSQSQQIANNVQTFWNGTGTSGPVIHDTPGFWGNANNKYIYVAPTFKPMTQYTLCNSDQPICNAGNVVSAAEPANGFAYGASPSISASSPTASEAIVWAIWQDTGNSESTTSGVLYAYDAVSMARLYNSSGTGSPCPTTDTIAPAVKFSVPTVANGNVYLGTQAVDINNNNTGLGTFYMFGLNRVCH
jgi:hypothetical protein